MSGHQPSASTSAAYMQAFPPHPPARGMLPQVSHAIPPASPTLRMPASARRSTIRINSARGPSLPVSPIRRMQMGRLRLISTFQPSAWTIAWRRLEGMRSSHASKPLARALAAARRISFSPSYLLHLHHRPPRPCRRRIRLRHLPLLSHRQNRRLPRRHSRPPRPSVRRLRRSPTTLIRPILRSLPSRTTPEPTMRFVGRSLFRCVMAPCTFTACSLACRSTLSEGGTSIQASNAPLTTPSLAGITMIRPLAQPIRGYQSSTVRTCKVLRSSHSRSLASLSTLSCR